MPEDEQALSADAEVTDLEEGEQQEAPPPRKADDAEALKRKNRELLAKVAKANQRERDRLKAQYPALTDEVLKGLDPERIEQILQAVQPQGGANPPPKPEVPDGFAHLDAIQTQATPGGNQQTYTAKQIGDMAESGALTKHQIEQIIAEGRMTA